MSTFTETISISLGPPYAGMDLRAQIFDVSDGSPIGSELDTGFVDVGNGFYTWSITFDDANGTTQGVSFYTSSSSTVLAQSIWTSDLLDQANGVETGLTVRGALRVMSAAMAGKLSGAGTTTVTIRNTADTKARITAGVDSDGNRAAVTLDPS